MKAPQSLGGRRGVQKGKVGVLVWKYCLQIIFNKTSISDSTQLTRFFLNQLTDHFISSYPKQWIQIKKIVEVNIKKMICFFFEVHDIYGFATICMYIWGICNG